MATFNWQTEPETIRRWIIPQALVAGEARPLDQDLTERLGVLTDGWTNVDLKIVINGVELDGSWLLPEIERQYNQAVAANTLTQDARQDLECDLREAKRLLGNVVAILMPEGA